LVIFNRVVDKSVITYIVASLSFPHLEGH